MKRKIENKPTNLDIKEWSEGNEHLEKLLISCRENNIPSMYCCAGHGGKRTAYITLQMNEQTWGKIYSLIHYLQNIPNTSFTFSHKDIFPDDRFSIHMLEEESKDGIMDSLAEAVTVEKKIKDLSIESQQLIGIVKTLLENKANFDLSYYHYDVNREIYLQNLIFKNHVYIDERKLTKLGLNPIRNGSNNTYCIDNINDNNESDILERLLKGIESICKRLNKKEKRKEFINKFLMRRGIHKDNKQNLLPGNLQEKDNSLSCNHEKNQFKESILICENSTKVLNKANENKKDVMERNYEAEKY